GRARRTHRAPRSRPQLRLATARPSWAAALPSRAAADEGPRNQGPTTRAPQRGSTQREAPRRHDTARAASALLRVRECGDLLAPARLTAVSPAGGSIAKSHRQSWWIHPQDTEPARKLRAEARRGPDRQVRGWSKTWRRTQECMVIAAAAAAFIDRVEPYWAMESTSRLAKCASSLSPGPSCPNSSRQRRGRS